MATKITRDVLESYLHCTYKAHLKLAGEQDRPSDYVALQGEARTRIQRAAVDRLIDQHKDGEIVRGVTLTRHLLKQGVPLILDATVEDHTISICFDALLRETGPSQIGRFHYITVVFHATKRLHDQQKMLLEL